MNVKDILKTKERQYILSVSELIDVLNKGHISMASFEFHFMLQNLITSLSVELSNRPMYITLSHIDYYIPSPEYSYKPNENSFVIGNSHKVLGVFQSFVLSKGLENDIQIYL